MSEKTKLKVGIIAAPERAADVSGNIIEKLANQFSKQIDEEIDWEMEHLVDRITGAAETAQDILSHATHIKRSKEWDYAICLTDLPIFYNKDIVAADISFNYKVAQISIPAFGWAPMQKRIEKTIVQLLSELHENYTTDRPKHFNSRTAEKQKEKSVIRMLKRQFPIMPICRQENPDISFKSDSEYVNNELRETGNLDSDSTREENYYEHKNSSEQNEYSNDTNIDIRFFVYPRLKGRLRLILGMTFANNPLKIMSSFKNVIAIAFTTGAFALIFPTIWNLGQILSVFRLSGMMFTAIFGLVVWIIAAHNLWEYPSKQNKPNIRRLYNLATISTLMIDVVTYYIFIFFLFLAACFIFIPVEYFQSMINEYGDAVSIFVNYMRVAWATTSISTIVSAIGAGLENEELVRNITYGYRQRRRYEEVNNNKKS